MRLHDRKKKPDRSDPRKVISAVFSPGCEHAVEAIQYLILWIVKCSSSYLEVGLRSKDATMHQ